jgi:hypothetical protein
MYIYFDETRESETYSLPDCEVFYHAGMDEDFQGYDGKPLPAGWYWWPCFPGCLPDGDPVGPFETEEEAIEDARDF